MRMSRSMNFSIWWNLPCSSSLTNVMAAPEAAARLTALADEDERILHEITAERGCLHVKDLAVSGNDLLALGLKPGAAVGETLSRLLDLVLDEEVPNEKEALLAAAQKEMQTHE